MQDIVKRCDHCIHLVGCPVWAFFGTGDSPVQRVIDRECGVKVEAVVILHKCDNWEMDAKFEQFVESSKTSEESLLEELRNMGEEELRELLKGNEQETE